MSDLEGIVLAGLADQFGSDKGTKHPRGALNYMPLYAEYFARHGFTRTSDLRILEIGTNTGASLRTWAEYFTNSQIYGLDITRRYENPTLLEHPRIVTELADQGRRESLEKALAGWPEFDLIIDDGSHEQEDQQVSLGFLFRGYLKNGGLYVVEDLITGENWWDARTYNEKGIIPTRNLLQLFQQTSKMESPVMLPEEVRRLQYDTAYCEYRETPQIIYGQHHPQIAFLGKKNG